MQNPFTRNYSQNELELFDFLQKNRLFAQLNRKEMLLFLPYLHLRVYKQDEVVFFRKDPSQALYLLKEGDVTLELDVANHFETIAKVSKNASFGNNALLPKSKRLYSAIVSSPFCHLYVLPQVNILTIFENKPVIKAKMFNSLTEILNEQVQLIYNTYRNRQGFFELGDMFGDLVYGQ